MLDALKFVQRGVARKGVISDLSYFRIKDRRVTGFNGSYALSAPVDIGFNIAPQANLFVRALNACEDVIQLHMDGEALVIQSGKFVSSVPCLMLDDVPDYTPEGVLVASHTSILDALSNLREFIGELAPQEWSTGVLLRGSSAFATNNVVIAEYWLGTPFPHIVNIPSIVVDEVVKINEELSAIQIGVNSLTFHYADGRWIKTQLLNLDWPDVESVLNNAWNGGNLQPVTPGLADACETLAPFVGKTGRLYFHGDDVSTSSEWTNETTLIRTATPERGIYRAEFLNQVLAVATHIDFGKYPQAIPFVGNNLRGALLGQVK